jgi:predicted MFS family arabinose efflux permease
MATEPVAQGLLEDRREHLLWVLTATTFLIFFQAYMVAPLIPRLSALFGVSAETMGLIVPAYMIPYGVSTLFYGLISDRLGPLPVMLASLIAFILLTAATAISQSSGAMVAWRLLTGLGASGVVPLGLALIGDLFPYERRGRPLGWMFGAMAGGMAFGSTVGVLVEPFIGWRMLFVAVAALATVTLVLLLPYGSLIRLSAARPKLSLGQVFVGYRGLLGTARGARTYAYVFLNAIFHSGVYTWLGLYLTRRYSLGEIGVGLALLGYGVPGMILGPIVGRTADRRGRRWLIPIGLTVAALSAAILIPSVPLFVAALAVTTLSLGYDMTQPLLAGIVTSLDPKRGGQAMGLNVFTLFTGFGLGSFVFSQALYAGFGIALAIFTGVQLAAAAVSIGLFRLETPAAKADDSSRLASRHSAATRHRSSLPKS